MISNFCINKIPPINYCLKLIIPQHIKVLHYKILNKAIWIKIVWTIIIWTARMKYLKNKVLEDLLVQLLNRMLHQQNNYKRNLWTKEINNSLIIYWIKIFLYPIKNLLNVRFKETELLKHMLLILTKGLSEITIRIVYPSF